MNINQWMDYPAKQVIIAGGEGLTTADLMHNVALIQAKLTQDKVSSCALYTNDTTLFLSTFLACACSAVNLVLPANNDPDFVARLQTDWFIGDLPESQTFDFSIAVAQPAKVISDDFEIEVFTSGSTGQPKQISRSIEQLIAEITTLQDTWGDLTHGTLFAATVSHQHIYGLLFKILWPLLSQNMIWNKQVPFEETIDDLVLRFKQVVLISSPAFLKRINDNHSRQGSLVHVFSSGGLLIDDLHAHAEKRLNCHITQVYGSSETGGIAYRGQQQYWQLLNDVKTQVRAGVLWVKSPYCHQTNWLCTSDMVEFVGTRFKLKDRIDGIVKIEEKRVSLRRVEAHIIKHDWVNDAAVLKMENGRQYLAAVIVLNQAGETYLIKLGPAAVKKEIKNQLKNQIELISVPKRIHFIDCALENSQGKRVVKDLMRYFQ